ncbi:TPA: colanic acid biosynthesis glycosyltransferase WcaL [Candidatus Bathyarchaeota archaeon]|nr:colanic acid biosynthesis glycosyltransferase WcaL [Candidatus Bathyarchaeota archaeon]
MKYILYISYILPSVTTTFVHREIQVLRNAGYRIDTVSMSKPGLSDVHPEALPIYETTTHLDQVGFFRKLFSQVELAIMKPKTFCRLLCVVFSEKEISGYKDRLRLLWHFIGAGYLYSLFKHTGIDQIQATFLNGPASIAFFLSEYLQVPYSFTIHASNIFLDPIMLGRKLSTCKKIVTISDYNKEYLLKKYGKELEEKLHIIHCGIDVEEFRPSAVRKSNIPFILSVGQLTERKGFIYLLEACAILKKKGYSFKCCIVGDGEDREILANKFNSLGLDGVVEFLGRKLQDEVRELLGKATIFCLPSIITEEGGREGIPVALMEAMAMELPVVSTKTVGIPELVEHQKEGLLVPAKKTKALAEALEIFLTDKDLRIEMGTAARRKVSKDFNIANIPEEFKMIFD